MSRAGYYVLAPEVLNAADYGVPQARRRLFLLGWRNDCDPVAYPGRCHGDYGAATVQQAFVGLPNAADFPQLFVENELVLTGRHLLSWMSPRSEFAQLMRGERMLYASNRKWPRGALSGMRLTKHQTAVVRRFAATLPGEREPISRFPRLDPRGLAPTLRAGTGPEHGSHTPPRPIHPSGDRVITVREAARLQSFPDWFYFHPTKWHAWRGVGNAVPPLMARAVAGEVAAKCS